MVTGKYDPWDSDLRGGHVIVHLLGRPQIPAPLPTSYSFRLDNEVETVLEVRNSVSIFWTGHLAFRTHSVVTC